MHPSSCGALLLLCGAAAGPLAVPATALRAQGITTAAVQGTVRVADGGDPEGATVTVRHTGTGHSVVTEPRRGRFLVQGLEPGGPYTITVRRIGAFARRWDGVFLAVGEPLALDVTLEPAPARLDSIVVVAADPAPLPCCLGGAATTLSDSLVHRLPSLNRDVYDFVRLVPQISTRIGFAPGGISGGGVGFRFNSFLTNGVPERSLPGSQPPEFAGGRSLPFDAVREYQVLLAPFDVRYGDFAGALVNTVTRAGSNRFEGSAFTFGRSGALAREGAASPYERWQYGLSLSGPIARDRVHFLVATELQRREEPMAGPFVGQSAGASPPVPISTTDLARLERILDSLGLEAGSAGAVDNRNRVRNIFVRLDASLPWNSRAVLWVNDSDVRDQTFSRTVDSFPLSSNAAEVTFDTRTLALQLHTALRRGGGGHNELSVSRRTIPFGAVPEVIQPVVQVAVPSGTGGTTTVVTGTPQFAQGGVFTMRDVILRDDLTLPLGSAHVASFGLEAEWFRIGDATSFVTDYGSWTFPSLDALEAGAAERYELVVDRGGGVPLSGRQLAWYAGDRWQLGSRIALTLGLRADLLALNGRAPYNRLVDSLFGRRTDAAPSRLFELSPRLGFHWDLQGGGRDQLRGGAGIFTARPPLAWFHVPRQDYGHGIGALRCGSDPVALGPSPAFDPDPLDPPVTCAGGEGPLLGDVDLVDPELSLARTLRVALAYDRRLPGGFVGTLEGLLTRNLSDFAFVNLNLAGPRGTDSRGRVMYGGHTDLGQARPDRVTNTLPSVVELRNVTHNSAVQVSAGLARQFGAGFAATASYTWSRVRDVQTPLRVNFRGLANWSLRAVSGRHDDLSPGISLNDVPHRIVLAGTWRAPWRRWLTELSLLYVGESGSPFTYRAGGVEGRGDLNADGALNDPIYVPRNALDPTEIALTDEPTSSGADQRTVLEEFIQRSPCLRRRRGRIVERNSCREPWAHTTAASLRQTLPIGGQAIEAQLDVFNVLNLLDGDWGLRRSANPVLLRHVSQTPGPSGTEPVFRFDDAATEWNVDPTESGFQLQFGLRYRL